MQVNLTWRFLSCRSDCFAPTWEVFYLAVTFSDWFPLLQFEFLQESFTTYAQHQIQLFLFNTIKYYRSVCATRCSANRRCFMDLKPAGSCECLCDKNWNINWMFPSFFCFFPSFMSLTVSVLGGASSAQRSFFCSETLPEAAPAESGGSETQSQIWSHHNRPDETKDRDHRVSFFYVSLIVLIFTRFSARNVWN